MLEIQDILSLIYHWFNDVVSKCLPDEFQSVPEFADLGATGGGNYDSDEEFELL